MQSVWDSLLSTDSGILSIAVFVFMLAMAVFFIAFFIRRIRAEESGQAPAQQSQPH
jgi:hypothetical protein